MTSESRKISSQMCRICMKSRLELKFSLEDCVEMIKNVAQVEPILVEMDDFPNRVCNPCFQMLVVADDIRTRCMESQKFFLEEIGRLTKHEAYEVEKNEIDSDTDVLVEVQEAFVDIGLRCCFCDETLDEFEAFKTHCLEVHMVKGVAEDTKENCRICATSLEKTRHRTCETCLEVFEGEMELDEHSALHKEGEDTEMQEIEYLEPVEWTEEEVKKPKLRYSCCQCTESSQIKSELVDHFRSAHKDVISAESSQVGYICFLCKQSFQSKIEVREHMRAPHRQTFTCQSCTETFTSEFKLQRHNDREHPGVQTFECDQCERSYQKKSSLDHHKYTMHNEAKIFHCDICNKDFHRKGFFKEHRNAHLGIKPHKCTYCVATFSRRNNLVQHLRKHTGERPFVCKVCDKSYAHYTDLKRHSYIHTKNWPFECIACSKGFSKKSAIVAHLKIHGDLEEYLEK